MKKWLIIALLFLTNFAFAVDQEREVAKRLVKEAIAYSKAHGSSKTIDAINGERKFMEGSIYVTIFDMKATCLAHPTKPDRIGVNFINEKDADGVAMMQDRVRIAEKIVKGPLKDEERWQYYKFQNPLTKKLEPKAVYLDVYEGLIYAAGAYHH